MSVAVLMALLLPAALAAREVRESYNAAGKPVRSLVLVDGVLASETTFRYDGSNLVEKTVTEGAQVTVEKWTWDGSSPLTHEVRVDGTVKKKETWTWVQGKVATWTVEVTGEPTRTTVTTRDALGNPVEVVTRLPDGTVVDHTVAEFDRPAVPSRLSLSGGGGYQSDVKVASVTTAFSLTRSPPAALVGMDPLEYEVGVGWSYSRSGQTLVNNDLTGRFAMDYNHIVPRTTLFLFTTWERNPVTNLSMDLLVAPLGLKFEVVNTPRLLFDASFAPLWNYRSIVATAGGTCDGATVEVDGPCETSKLRGSLRVRARVDTRSVDFTDTFGWLPNLYPAALPQALVSDAIWSNSATLSLALSKALSLQEGFTFALDPTLKDQADCAADPDNLLCDGVEFATTTTLTLAFDVGG